jgi:hypothetical protein
MKGLTFHDIKIIVLTMFRGYMVFVYIGVKQAYISGSDGVWQLN